MRNLFWNIIDIIILSSLVKNEDKNNTGNVLGMLLYAKTDNEEIGWKEYKMGENIIVITSLDLEQEFEQIKKKLDNIAIWFKSKTE